MNKKNKSIVIITIITCLLLVTLGITYAAFTYNKTGGNSQLVLGDIYMHYIETNQLTIENAMPSSTYDASKYFEFTINGKNTYEKNDIWYEIVLSHGDNHDTRTERIKDNLLRFRLTEVVDGVETELFTNRSYSDLTNKRIWVNTIPKNTTTEINKTYRLYMWISNSAKIGNTSDADYDTETWNNLVFGSIKVNVTGDFNEKEVVYTTDESCFKVGTVNNGSEVAIIDYDETCGSNVIIPDTIQGYPVTVIGNSNTNIITLLGNKQGQASLNSLVLKEDVNVDSPVPIMQPDPIGAFQEKNLISVVIPNGVTYIDGVAFYSNQLTSVVIPDSVTYIGSNAFESNQLTSIVIPNGVTIIDSAAFSYNQLTSIEIPNSVTEIWHLAFRNNKLTNVTIPDSVKIFYCNSFDDTVVFNKRSDLECTPFQPPQ